MQRDYERGRALLEEAIALHRESGNSEGLAVALHNLARVHLRTGRNDEARRSFREALDVALDLRYREVIAHGLEGCAELALTGGAAAGAARLIGAAEAMLDDLGIAMSGDDAEMYEATLVALQRELGDDFDRARRAGRELPMADAVEEALRAA